MEPRTEYVGHWWIPGDAENGVSGTLEFGSGGDIKLTTVGPLLERPEELDGPLDTITGLSVDGKSVTLQECRYTGMESSYPGIERQKFSPRLAAIGMGLEAPTTPLYTWFSFRFTNIDAWVGRHGFRLETARSPTSVSLTYDPPAKLDYVLPDYRMSLTSSAKWSLPSSTKAFQLTQSHWVTIDPFEPTSIEAIRRCVARLRDFFSLAVGEPVYVEQLWAKSDLATFEFQDRVVHERIELRMRGVSVPPAFKPAAHSAGMLLPFHAVEDDLGEMLSAWVRASDEIGPVLDLYFGTLYDDALYPERHLLFLAQAVETYHRRTSDETDLPQEQHDRRMQEILNGQSDHRDWLEQRLQFSNELSLRRRVKTLTRRYKNVLGDYISPKSFADRVVNTRNYLTHYTREMEGRSAKGIQLVDLVFKLRTLLEACLLSELGLADDQIALALRDRIREREFIVANNTDR